MSDEPTESPKPWKELSKAERAQRIADGKAAKAAQREAAQEVADAALLQAPVEGPVVAASPVGEPDDAAAERRRRLLGDDIDPTTAALFSDAELEEIEREEQDKAKLEAKKQAITDVRAIARQQARVEHDLIPANVLRSDAEKQRLAEPITFIIRLPGDGAGHRGRNGFRVDGFLYQVGRTYTRPRAVFESLQANHYRAWLNEVRFKTLDQHKSGNSAEEILAQTIPQFEVRNAA